MRTVLFLLASIAALAQTPTLGFGNDTEGWGYSGPQYVFEGYSTYHLVTPHWEVALTCNAGTDRCDSGSYTPTGAETAYAYGSDQGGFYVSATAMPSGLKSMYGGILATYRACDISGSVFSLRPGFITTVSVTNGSPTVNVASGYTAPNLSTYLENGGVIKINGVSYTISTRNSATQITLTTNYSGTTSSATSLSSECGGPIQTFTTAGTSVKMYYDPGTTFYLIGNPTGGPTSTSYTYHTAEPSGISGTWGIYSGSARQLYLGKSEKIIEVAVPDGATPGSYTLSFSLATNADGTGTTGTFTMALDVMTLTPLTHTPPSSTTAIPNLSTWEATMIASGTSNEGGGAYWCNKTTGVPNPSTLSFGNESEIWYYDGARVYSQIATYTGDTDWNNCRNNIAAQYQSYVDGNGGGLPGYRVFPHGLGLMYAAGQGAGYKTSVDSIASTTLYALFGGSPNDYSIREVSYAGDVYAVQQNYLGESANANLGLTANMTLGHLQSWCYGGPKHFRLWFQAGLAAEWLIQYNTLNPDPRVPVVLKCIADLMTSQYDASGHILSYAGDPDGPYCNTTAQWYALDVIGSGCNASSSTVRVLNLLIAPVYAWLWQYTADTAYRDQGDELWNYCVLYPTLPFGGKNFSQQYRWSFDYVTWRTEVTASTGTGSRFSGTVHLSGTVRAN